MLLDKLKTWFEGSSENVVATEEDLQLATASLLVEMARADFNEDSEEQNAIVELLTKHFDLDKQEAEALMQRAENRVDESVSLHEFTSQLHQRLTPEDKKNIVLMLWRVALSDGNIDRYEDYLVRKVADLLYVDHVDLVRLKHVALEKK